MPANFGKSKPARQVKRPGLQQRLPRLKKEYAVAEGSILKPSLRDPSHRLRLRAPPSYKAEGGHGFENTTLCGGLNY